MDSNDKNLTNAVLLILHVRKWRSSREKGLLMIILWIQHTLSSSPSLNLEVCLSLGETHRPRLGASIRFTLQMLKMARMKPGWNQVFYTGGKNPITSTMDLILEPRHSNMDWGCVNGWAKCLHQNFEFWFFSQASNVCYHSVSPQDGQQQKVMAPNQLFDLGRSSYTSCIAYWNQ